MSYLLIGVTISLAFASETELVDHFSNTEFQIYLIKEQHYEFFIPYSVSPPNTANLKNFDLMCESTSIVIELDSVRNNNKFTISIPRDMINPKTNGNDDIFFVILDGQEVDNVELNSNDESRTLSFPLHNDAKIIELITTHVGQFPQPVQCGVGNMEKESPYFRLLTPLKQIKNGISYDEIKCASNLNLIYRYDGAPACVKPETKQKLIEREWTLG